MNSQRPLSGLRVIDLGGIGPGPFAAMMLADLGAEVIRLDRMSKDRAIEANPVLDRGKQSLLLDLKQSKGRDIALRLLATAEASIEGFRPGVAERLGIGPVDAHTVNPCLVYGRMTGYGQEGPLAKRSGHDLNYIATSGVLASLGPANGVPAFPANLIGDFGGGGMLLALGIVSAVLQSRRTGEGTTIDAAMIDGSATLWAMMHGFEAMGKWHGGRGQNDLDGGAPYYAVYETSDKAFVAVGSLEPQFFDALIDTLKVRELLPELADGDHTDRAHWPRIRAVLTGAFGRMSRAEAQSSFANIDACVTPVLTIAEAEKLLHNNERRVFLRDEDDVRHPAPAPRFGLVNAASGAVDYPRPSLPRAASEPGGDSRTVLAGIGFTHAEIDSFIAAGVVGEPALAVAKPA